MFRTQTIASKFFAGIIGWIPASNQTGWRVSSKGSVVSRISTKQAGLQGRSSWLRSAPPLPRTNA